MAYDEDLADRMRGWLHVAGEYLQGDAELARWVDVGVGYASSLPPKG